MKRLSFIISTMVELFQLEYYFIKVLSDFQHCTAGNQILSFEHFRFKAKKKYVVFPVTLPTPIFGPYPKVFIKLFLFFIKPYIMLFVCQTRLGSLGVLHEL